MKKKSDYTVLGIGAPILDLLLKVDNSYLEKIPGKKGGMEATDADAMGKIIQGSGSTPLIAMGGSARNTLYGMTRFGKKCALLGMAGRDDLGKHYTKLLRGQGIYPLLIKKDLPTARVLSLITPDGERTFRTVQGASIHIRGKDLKPAYFEGVKLVHLEGYTLFNDDLADTAMHLAKRAGAKVSFDLANFEIVRRFREKILFLLENYVDILFANEDESLALTGQAEEPSCRFIAERAEVGIVLMGKKGCYAMRGSEGGHYPAYPVEPLDTTGAGDLFAAGFLNAYMSGYPLEICCHYGAIAGRAVVQIIGTEIPHAMWVKMFDELKISGG